MCGRFAIYQTDQTLEDYYDVKLKANIEDNYNISPHANIPVIIQENDENIFKIMRWGIVPNWSKDNQTGLFNARAETIAQKPSFKKSFESRRCIIPASGFYEWHMTTKQPYYIKPKSGYLSFAGIWDVWKSDEGDIIQTCAIITKNPNKKIAEIHTRMPVMLEMGDIKTWFGKNNIDILENLLMNTKGTEIELRTVSTQVNNSSHSGTELIKEVN